MKIKRLVITIAFIVGCWLILVIFAINKSTRHPPESRERSDARYIEAALRAFRFEYGRWPCDSTQAVIRMDTSAILENILNPNTNLPVCREMNPKGIRFINPGDLTDPYGRPYHILIDRSNDTCKVSWDKPPTRRQRGCGCN